MKGVRLRGRNGFASLAAGSVVAHGGCAGAADEVAASLRPEARCRSGDGEHGRVPPWGRHRPIRAVRRRDRRTDGTGSGRRWAGAADDRSNAPEHPTRPLRHGAITDFEMPSRCSATSSAGPRAQVRRGADWRPDQAPSSSRQRGGGRSPRGDADDHQTRESFVFKHRARVRASARTTARGPSRSPPASSVHGGDVPEDRPARSLHAEEPVPVLRRDRPGDLSRLDGDAVDYRP
jgi:hypothetical protein